MKTMGDRIRARRKILKMTQAELAMSARGIKRESLSQWENDIYTPEAENLLVLAAALKVTPQWLLTGRGDTPALLPNVAPALIGHRLIPIINEVQAGTWREIREDFQTTEMLLTDLELSPFALTLTVKVCDSDNM